ncbi:MAG: GDSL-type esterase/lipase family protein [Candidatus Bathyarchaeota archaeon]|nr:GDSL-type esterase/lipase family protein [Candidatus Bathyarchaeota archaeon]
MSLTIITFGDSLTTGFIPTHIAHQPYSRFLQQHLDNFCTQHSLTKLHIQVLNRGVNGNLTSDMLLRFRWDVLTAQPTYVIILGGTNDIGWGLPVDEIFANLTAMYTQACENNITPICCTVPSILGWDAGIPPRIQLNNHIQRNCHKNRLRCVDLFTQTCDPKTNRLWGEYSSDGLHFNVSGYQKMADVIYDEAIHPLLIADRKTTHDD